MKELVDESISILNSKDDIKPFGELLHESWEAKRSLSSSVSNPEVDEIYALARSSGAIGGKLTGAGGGGFLLLFVPPEKQKKIRKVFERLLNVPIKFEFSGSQIIYFFPEARYDNEEKFRNEHPIQAFHELEIDKKDQSE